MVGSSFNECEKEGGMGRVMSKSANDGMIEFPKSNSKYDTNLT